MAAQMPLNERSKRRSESARRAQQTNIDDSFEKDEVEIDLFALLVRLLEKAKYIVAAALAGAVLLGCVTIFIIPPKYTAVSKLYVLNSNDSAVNLSDLQIGSYLASDYQQVFQNWLVHDAVITNLGLDYTYSEISSMLTITNPSDTRILCISITAKSAAEAKLIADEYAAVAQEFIVATMETEQPNVFEPALLPNAPSSPSITRNILLGFMLGFVLMAGIIVIQFIMDDRIRSSEDIKHHLKYPCLGIMPIQDINVKKGSEHGAKRSTL